MIQIRSMGHQCVHHGWMIRINSQDQGVTAGGVGYTTIDIDFVTGYEEFDNQIVTPISQGQG